ncbi:hypothetical protein A3B42_00810 [Candidatus Daviesbacteria bacterium RIFCSPLOWO2_01_FULL_38_10]|nr:MAG: Glucose permease [Candidatus Daviesbacteria bacterium GW2011_GWA2_38_17]OGE26006.1 MAG: hypothetical protein A3D02_00645 [Candidatus Daviesbacteria bacterium RIFCSPHIGHO2_02_FULL_39_41]OGE39461.1 MAG: hypothetical protein A3B42_00810 [Candidatus Daviesbacteria bacterium RIFCSPLOWO2_01_FULL_38_10]OGE45730.1 MAG: hypothetical protein A3E67_01010 [Candidatus Daviesbacteria bacterium RIFCSPHIGHO2_12_FULL_38_25]OGE68171.1 MAG: hypothetical protein A3H81_04745 [Candidatus Daviesbacteria bacte
MENLGFLAALGSALFYGSYMVPFKKSKSSNLIQFQALMAVGIGLSGLIISIALNYPVNFNPYGLLGGVLWGSANAISLVAIASLGLSRAVPVMSSLVILSSFLWGALVFRELTSGIITGFIGIAFIILGVITVSSTSNTQSKNTKKGLLAAILAGLIFGSQLVPIKVGNVSTQDFFFPVCFGIFITGLLISQVMKVKFKKEAVKESLLSGLIWNIGNLLSLIALSIIGLSKMGPISQSAILVAVFWGLCYFKEITQRKQVIRILAGAVILLAGVVILGLA